MAVIDRELSVRVRRREHTRREILEAAWRLAGRDGVASLSLRDLAREVGMRAPSLYTYFDSKAAIYDAMFAEGYRELAAAEAKIDADSGDALDTLTTVLVEFLRFCQASIPRYQLMFTRVVPDWAPSPEAYAVSKTAYDSLAGQFARLGITDQQTLDLWTALSAGMAAQQLANDPAGDRWARLAREAAEMFLTHVRRTQ
ncbi:MAG TPA: helix-turn-helix domain-containing protein [Jiangellaceae bacterium]